MDKSCYNCKHIDKTYEDDPCKCCKYNQLSNFLNDLFPQLLREPKEENNENIPANDIVNRPAHYTDGKIEVIEYIEDKKRKKEGHA